MQPRNPEIGRTIVDERIYIPRRSGQEMEHNGWKWWKKFSLLRRRHPGHEACLVCRQSFLPAEIMHLQ